MRHVILATAGHIDHGKTELTRALTGIDTDRLPEEKARGITIDLGFAHFELGDRRLSVIDVPGHERFIKNMLAGVGSVDLALLVVAADESVMPQTREHLAILRLLGVRHGVVALTKRDLVDDDTLEVARLELQELLEGSFLERQPMVAVSARTGAGIDQLKDALEAALAKLEPRDSSGLLRMHVDRSFSVHGFGSVATGTLVSGRLRVGSELVVSPEGVLARVRGLEVHGQEVAEIVAGTRAALNLAGIEHHELKRGQQLLEPGAFEASQLLDARLELLDEEWAALRDLARVRLHLGAAEILARVRIIEPSSAGAAPGSAPLVQLRLERAVVAWPGDRFILRSYSPMRTIAGGQVIDPRPEKHRGRGGTVAAWLGALAEAEPAERLVLLATRAGRRGIGCAELAARLAWTPAAVLAEASRSPALRVVEGSEPRFVAKGVWEELEARALEELRSFHAREPLRPGISREELRARLCGEDVALAGQVLEGLHRRGLVRLEAELAALAAHRVSLSEEELALKSRIEQLFRSAGLTPPAPKDALDGLGGARAQAARLLPVLVREQRLVAVPGGLYFHAEALAQVRAQLREHAARGPISVADFKTLTGVSRKFAIPLLEYLDQTRFTRRQGDLRVVVGS